MDYKLIVGPSQEAISLSELKSWLKIEQDVDDTILTQLIIDAREYIEEYTNRAMFEQTWDVSLDELPDILLLRKFPLKSVTGIYYIDTDVVEYTEPSDHYIVDTFSGRIILKQDEVYDGRDYVRAYMGWRIRFISGETQYPSWAKRMVARVASHFYEKRDEKISSQIWEEIRRKRVEFL